MNAQDLAGLADAVKEVDPDLAAFYNFACYAVAYTGGATLAAVKPDDSKDVIAVALARDCLSFCVRHSKGSTVLANLGLALSQVRAAARAAWAGM